MKLPIKRAFLPSIVPAFALILAGCGPEPVGEASSAPEAAGVEVPWNWQSFSRSSELVLGTMQVDIQPKQSLSIKSEAAGILTFESGERVIPVQKGQVIARMDVETLAEQEERLAIQKERRILEEMKRENLDIPENRKRVREELEEARRKLNLVEMILKNPAMQEMSQELFGSDVGRINDKSLTEAREAFNLAQQKVAWMEEFDEKLQKGQQRIQEMDLSQSQRQHEQVKDRSEYVAPFAGELRLEVNHVEGEKQYTVAARETVATLNDYEEIHGHLGVSNAPWINLQPQRLHIQLNDRERTIMAFSDDRVARDERTMREERRYIFSVPLKNNESLKRLAGTQMNGQLIYKLPDECYIVPKTELSMYALGKTSTVEWAAMVKALWPAAEVVAEGQGLVAISYHGAR